jgi:hypothetical protein
MDWHEETLSNIAANDERFVEEVLSMHLKNLETSGLDARTHALARLGALVALDAAPASYHWTVGTAFADRRDRRRADRRGAHGGGRASGLCGSRGRGGYRL